MIARPGESREAVVQGFPTALSGTIGFQIIDNIGGVTLARTTAGIVERPASSGVYTITFTTPTDGGDYTLVWDKGSMSPSNVATEELVITTASLVSTSSAPGATALSTLINRTRRYVRDWPAWDTTTASLSSSVTTVAVADSSIYRVNWPIEIEQETMMVKALPSGTSLTVLRGAYGSTAVSHLTGLPVLINPAFYAVEYIDGLNAALDAAFPYLYKQVSDSTLVALANTYEYTIPNMPSPATQPIPLLTKIDTKEVGDFSYRINRRWEIRRGATPKIKFREVPIVGATIRVQGFGPFPHLTATSDTLDAQYPANAESILPIYAAGWLLQSGEAGRVRLDSGAVDTREEANRVGSSIQAGAALINRFHVEKMLNAMPPLPRHCVSVF